MIRVLVFLLLLNSCSNELFYNDNSKLKKVSQTNSDIKQNSVRPVKVIINEGEKSVFTNQIISLSAYVFMENGDINNSVIWQSSDTNIATVDNNGKISTLNSGKVVIKAISLQNPEILDSYVLLVSKHEKEVSDIIIKPPEKKNIKLNENLQLNAMVKYSDGSFSGNLEWELDSQELAYINKSGLLIPQKIGSLKIRAISTENKKVESSVNINIIENTITDNKDTYDLARDYKNKNIDSWEIGFSVENSFYPYKSSKKIYSEDNKILYMNYLDIDPTGSYIINLESDSEINYQNNIYMNNYLYLFPGFSEKYRQENKESYTTVRWISPGTGYFKINSEITGANIKVKEKNSFYINISHNNTTLFSDFKSVGTIWENEIFVSRNDFIDFKIGSNMNNQNLTKLNIIINKKR